MTAKREEEACTLVHRRPGPDAAPVAGNNAGDRRKTDAGAFKLGCLMQALERREKLPRAFHIETRSVISHAKNSFIYGFLENKRDPGIRLFARELPGIAQQVVQRDFDKTFVAERS